MNAIIEEPVDSYMVGSQPFNGEEPLEGDVIANQPAIALEDGMPHFESFDEWGQFGELLSGNITNLKRRYGALMFALGDWWMVGEGEYGQEAYQAVAATGYHIKTIRNAAWVARNIPQDERRATLDFGHHDACARMEFLEREKWLTLAENEDLTIAELRKRIRDERAEQEAPRLEREQQEAADSVAAMLKEQAEHDDDSPFPMLGNMRLVEMGQSYVIRERQGSQDEALATVYHSERSTDDGTPLAFALANYIMEVLNSGGTETQEDFD